MAPQWCGVHHAFILAPVMVLSAEGKAHLVSHCSCILAEHKALNTYLEHAPDACYMTAGCPGDCAFPLVACPAPAGGVPCSNRGWCASAFGACQCWFGYAGDDCSQCAEGYIR